MFIWLIEKYSNKITFSPKELFEIKDLHFCLLEILFEGRLSEIVHESKGKIYVFIHYFSNSKLFEIQCTL